MSELVFVGTGEALDPDLPNTSLLVRAGGVELLMDCGYAIPHAFWRLSRDPEQLDAVWISHWHADHCFGLPALLLWMRLAGRRRALTLIGGPGSRARFDQLLELGYPGSFAPHKCYPIEHLELEPGAPGQLGQLELRIAASAHSLVNYALRLDAPGLRPLCYSGDGAPTEATRALIHGVSLLVHECFFARASSAEPRKHGALDELVQLGRSCGVDTLALLHFAAEDKAQIRARVRALVAAKGAEPASAGLELLTPAPGERISLDLPQTGGQA